MKRAFDTLLAPVPVEWRVPVVIGGLCLSILLKNVVVQLNHYVTQYADGKVAHNLRVKVLQQTIESCVDDDIENRRSDIVTTLANNTWTIGATLVLVYRMAVCSITVLVFAILMFAVSVPLSVVALAGFGMIAVAIGFATACARSRAAGSGRKQGFRHAPLGEHHQSAPDPRVFTRAVRSSALQRSVRCTSAPAAAHDDALVVAHADIGSAGGWRDCGVDPCGQFVRAWGGVTRSVSRAVVPHAKPRSRTDDSESRFRWIGCHGRRRRRFPRALAQAVPARW